MILLLKYLLKTEKTAKNTDEAKKLALAELGIIDENDAIITIEEEGSKGRFLGIGSKDARVSASVKDANAVIAKTFLGQVFDKMGMDVEITAKSSDESLNVEMAGEHMGLVIGKRGDTLDALQYLTSLVVNHESTERVRVILDTENYREKRQNSLTSLSQRLADKVVRTGKKHTLEPMNPYERRIIHSSLQSNDKVTTYSVGEEPFRRLVIAPKDAPAKQTASAPRRITIKNMSDYRQQNHNKHKNFDEFLSENSEEL